MNSIFVKAREIAVRDLRNNYSRLGIYAGPNRHKDYMARDFFISSFGALAIGDKEVVRKGLNTFIKYQRADGHVPARIEEQSHKLKAIGITWKYAKLKIKHRQDQPFAIDVIDANSWFIISAANYVLKTKDKAWLSKNKNNLIKAFDWLTLQVGENGLIYEGFVSNWCDCNYRRGYLLYNNILYWKAAYDLAILMGGKNGQKYKEIATNTKAKIFENFWSPRLGYFLDRADKKGADFEYFQTDGNILAIWFGMVGSDKAQRIFDYIERYDLDQNPIPSGHPRLNLINETINRLFFPFYRTQNSFTWLAKVLVLARIKMGDKKGALKNMKTVSEKIIEYGTCHEVLAPNGKPVDMIIYQSEKGIAWTAALYLLALVELKKKKWA